MVRRDREKADMDQVHIYPNKEYNLAQLTLGNHDFD